MMTVAASDNQSRQCIQMSYLFPGRAEGPERGAGTSRWVSGEKRQSPSRLGSLGAPAQKNFQKSTLKSRIFCKMQTEMVLSAVQCRQGIIIATYMDLDRYAVSVNMLLNRSEQ